MITTPVFPELTREFLNNVTGSSFEELCLRIYKYKYSDAHVQQTNVNDFGADVVVHFNHDRKMVIQCKTSQVGKDIGVKAVQEVIASRQTYGASFAIVVTNTDFTRAATELAQVNFVTLVNGTDLIREFSTSMLDVEDIGLIYNNVCMRLAEERYAYLERFQDDPTKVLEISKLETIYMLKLILADDLPSELVDITDKLFEGVRHIIYLGLKRSKTST